MYLHYIRKIINEVLDQLKWFEKANVRPNTVIPYPRANGLTALLDQLIMAVENEHPNEAELLKDCIQRGLIVSQSAQKYKFNLYIFGEVSIVQQPIPKHRGTATRRSRNKSLVSL